MSKRIFLLDEVVLKPVAPVGQVKDFLETKQVGGGLKVRIAATHAGRLTRNNALYLPDKMRASVHTWLTPFKKPILLHHEDAEDPIGRIINAQYIDLSTRFRDKYVNQGNRLVDTVNKQMSASVFDALVSGKLSLQETVDICNQYIINDTSLNEDPDYEGLGYIELLAEITDPTAIPKILDGRYLTGSQSAFTDQAVCSICKTDWAGDGEICEHHPGKIYDGKKCVLIAGSFIYDEWSFVNKPADAKSQILAITQDGINAEGQLTREMTTIDLDDAATYGKIPIVALTYEQISPQEDKTMKVLSLEDAKTLVLENKKNAADRAEEMVKTIFQYIEENKLAPCDTCEPTARDVFLTVLDELYPEEQEVVEGQAGATDQQVEDAVKAFFGEVYGEIVAGEPEDRHYAEMLFYYVSTAKDEVEKATFTKEVMDAKLSSKQRKGMSKSTFCKPSERKYPVNDCGHAKSAMAYAKKYNESSSVLACIRRKAARLGCPFSSEKDAVQDVGQFVIDYFDTFDDTELQQLYLGVQKALSERKLNVIEDRVDAADTSVLSADLQTANIEIERLNNSVVQLEAALIDTTSQLKNARVAHITDLKYLVGEKIEDRTALVVELQTKTLDECNATLQDYLGKVDKEQIREKMVLGLTSMTVSDSVVDNPTVLRDNMNNEGQKVKLTPAEEDRVRAKYLELRLQPGGQQRAVDYIRYLESRGIITDGLFNKE